MKKLFIYILALFFLYIHAGHNTVMAFSISQSNNNTISCHQVHNPVEEHKCCFISDSHSENTPTNIVIITIEKVKKQTFSIVNQNNGDFGYIQEYFTQQPHGPPKTLYTQLIGIIKNIC